MASNGFSCLSTHRVQKLENHNNLCGWKIATLENRNTLSILQNLHFQDCPLEARYFMPNKSKLESTTASIYFALKSSIPQSFTPCNSAPQLISHPL